MTKEEYEKLIDKKLLDFQANNLDKYDNELIKLTKQLKQELMSEFKEEEPSIDGWKVGDKYFYRNSRGGVSEDIIITTSDGNIDDLDIARITHGYAKHTSEEVQFQIERDAVLYELSKYAEPKDRIWDNNLQHYYIGWTHVGENEICVGANIVFKRNDIYFASKNDAEKAIKAVGEERIKKYYLQMED